MFYFHGRRNCGNNATNRRCCEGNVRKQNACNRNCNRRGVAPNNCCNNQCRRGNQGNCCEPKCVCKPQMRDLCNFQSSVCQPVQPSCCFNEEDYRIACLEKLMAEYNAIECKADEEFNCAVVKLAEAIESIKKGLKYNKDGLVVWKKIGCWLDRYYKRYGEYCDCIYRRQEICEFVGEMIKLELESLDQAICACDKLKESRELDKQLHCMKRDYVHYCFPKC